jgi:hypothetical protein
VIIRVKHLQAALSVLNDPDEPVLPDIPEEVSEAIQILNDYIDELVSDSFSIAGQPIIKIDSAV